MTVSSSLKKSMDPHKTAAFTSGGAGTTSHVGSSGKYLKPDSSESYKKHIDAYMKSIPAKNIYDDAIEEEKTTRSHEEKIIEARTYKEHSDSNLGFANFAEFF